MDAGVDAAEKDAANGGQASVFMAKTASSSSRSNAISDAKQAKKAKKPAGAAGRPMSRDGSRSVSRSNIGSRSVSRSNVGSERGSSVGRSRSGRLERQETSTAASRKAKKEAAAVAKQNEIDKRREVIPLILSFCALPPNPRFVSQLLY